MLFLKKPHFLCADSLILLESCILFLFVISYYTEKFKMISLLILLCVLLILHCLYSHHEEGVWQEQ